MFQAGEAANAKVKMQSIHVVLREQPGGQCSQNGVIKRKLLQKVRSKRNWGQGRSDHRERERKGG